MTDVRYDSIGVDYTNLRRPDPRIAAHIQMALGDARTVLNVGAGAGSYEPVDRIVTALEPSKKMIDQRPKGAAPVVQGYAENIPFEDNHFDAVMAVLTVHHWADQAKGMAEMRRVTAGPVVILTFDPQKTDFWLTDYFPALVSLDDEQMPPMPKYEEWLGPVETFPVLIPHDCRDGFMGAWWRRPAAYLDARVRAAISSFWMIGDLTEGLSRLNDDLKNGHWEQKYGALMSRETLDVGYRLVVAERAAASSDTFG